MKRLRLKQFTRVMSLVLTGVVLVFISASCSKPKKTERPESVKVKTMKVSAYSHVVGKSYMGTIEEEDGANVTFGVLGTVVRVMAEEGQFVRKGQPLAEVDGQTVRSSYEISRSTLEQTEDAYRRIKDLYDKGTLPEIRMVEMESMLTKARAAEAISRKSVDEIVLRAPFDGFVASCNAHVGGGAAIGVTGFRLVKIDRVKVKMSVPEKEIGKIAKGQTVQFTVGALGDSIFTGTIVNRGITANLVNHAYAVSAIVENRSHILLPGMVCKARLEEAGADYAIVIPQQAIQISGHDKFVWKVQAGKAHRQEVSTGDIISDGVIVESGLTTGDEIIIEGQNKVCEDTVVEVS